MKFLKFLIPLLFVPAMLGATAIEYTVVADTTAIYPSKGERGVKVLNGEFKMYRSTGDISLDFHVNEGSVAIASQLTVPAVIISTFTMDVGATVDYVLTTDANGVGTWQATVTGVTDHAALTSTGTLTHVQLETSLDNIGIATGTLRTDVTALEVSTGTMQTEIDTNISDITALGVATGTLRTDITAIGVATGSIRTDFEAADLVIGITTGSLRTDITALEVSTGAIAISTGAIQTQVDNIAVSTGILRVDLDAVILSTGAIQLELDTLAIDVAIDTAALQGLIDINIIDISNLEVDTATLQGLIHTNIEDIAALETSTSTLQDNIDLKVSKTGDTMTGQLVSTLAIGTSPFDVTSTTVNTNLNTDLLDGYHSSDFYILGTSTKDWTVTNVSTDTVFDADLTTVNELADIIGTLIQELKAINILKE